MTTIPPHLPVIVPGVHGYTHEKSVHAGERIGFHISATVPYQLSVYQLGSDPCSRATDRLLHRFAQIPAQAQPIHPGSYVWIERGLSPTLFPHGLSFDVWLKPWDATAHQGVISEHDGTTGWGLFLTSDGRIAMQLNERLYRGPVLPRRRWTHVAASVSSGEVALWVDGQRAGEWLHEGPIALGVAPLRIGAAGSGTVAAFFLDADLAMPTVYSGMLGENEVLERFEAQALRRPVGGNVLACWSLREEHGAKLHDSSGHARTGTIINHATWMIGGPTCTGGEDPIFSDNGYEPLRDPRRGHGLRFASDDLVDCRWSETQRLQIPLDAKPGLYVGRIEYSLDGKPLTYDITFIVKRAQDAKPAAMLVLCSTNSWLAYNSTPFMKNPGDRPVWPRRAAGLEAASPATPKYGSYTYHRAGQPSYYTGLHMPWPSACPDALYAPEGAGFGQWAHMERHLHVWLDAHGYDYDVVADHDVDRNPALFNHYRTVVIAGHSEYWSVAAADGLDAYLAAGGSAIVLSGNTMYWRVSFDRDYTVMEQRKSWSEADVTGPPAGPYTEQYHSQDWARGGLMRNLGHPPATIIGLESAGWAFAEGEDFGVYHVEQPEHFIFHEPNDLRLVRGATFGHGPGGALPRAVGHEWDLTVQTLIEMTRDAPAGESLPRADPSIQIIACGRRQVPGKLDAYLDCFSRPTQSLDGLSAEMIYWERPRGGRVFNAGACAASWVLSADTLFAGLLVNVLHHFGVMPARGGAP
jgi:N,N-dimethylformamidase